MDDERLKNPPGPGVPDYFDELLERIRDIRASERRMYLRVREILALASDYSATELQTQLSRNAKQVGSSMICRMGILARLNWCFPTQRRARMPILQA